jgi:hypothetical protein
MGKLEAGIRIVPAGNDHRAHNWVVQQPLCAGSIRLEYPTTQQGRSWLRDRLILFRSGRCLRITFSMFRIE